MKCHNCGAELETYIFNGIEISYPHVCDID